MFYALLYLFILNIVLFVLTRKKERRHDVVLNVNIWFWFFFYFCCNMMSFFVSYFLDMLFSLFSWSRWCSRCKDFRRKREEGVGIHVHVFFINFMLSLLPWFSWLLKKGVGERGGVRKKRIHVFKDFMVSKYLKNRDLMKKRIDVYMIYDFLVFMLSLLAWFFIIHGKGGNMLSWWAWNFWML